MPYLIVRDLPSSVTFEAIADHLWSTMSLAIDKQQTSFYRQPDGSYVMRFNLSAQELVPLFNLYFAHAPFEGNTLTFEKNLPHSPAPPRLKVESITFELPDGKEKLNKHGLPILEDAPLTGI